jgi:hypothetical protein
LENGGDEKILASRLPVKICLILLDSRISLGDTVGSLVQPEKTSLVTQKSYLFTPVPRASVPASSSAPSPSNTNTKKPFL